MSFRQTLSSSSPSRLYDSHSSSNSIDSINSTSTYSLGSIGTVQDWNTDEYWDYYKKTEFDKFSAIDRITFLTKVKYTPLLINPNELMKFYMNIIRDKNIEIDIKCDELLRRQLFELLTNSPGSRDEEPDLNVPERIRFRGIPTLRKIIKKHSKSTLDLDDEFTNKTTFCNKVMVEFFTIKMNSNDPDDEPFAQLREEIHNMLSEETRNFDEMIQKPATSPSKKTLKKTKEYDNLHGNTAKYAAIEQGSKNKTRKNQKTQKK